MGKSIARKRKRLFKGNRFTNVPKMTESTASSSKLNETLLSNVDDDNAEFVGNRIMDINILKLLFAKLACPKCFCLGLTFKEDSRYGLCSHLVVNCDTCGFTEGFSSSPKVKSAPEVNMRLIYGMRQLGKGHSGSKLFCATMNLPPPPAKSSFLKTKAKLLKAVSDVALTSMNEAAEEVKKLSKETIGKHVACGVSIDGTWQRRGYSSLNGCVAAISIDSGKVVDVEAMSSFCTKCKKISSMKPSAEKESSCADHICRCNYEGTAGNMEVIGASRIFQRSIERRGLVYNKYFGDGDSKGYEKVKNCYNVENNLKIVVEKYECIGHVQKRVGTRLRKLKKTVKGLSGKGKLTDSFIDRLQNYYGIAIRSNKNNLQGMQQAVIAAFFHCVSGSNTPMHGQCPLGVDSWCYYQRAAALGKTPHCVNPGLKKEVVNTVKRVYMELCCKELLSKCIHGKTQNANESFNGNIWNRVPKECFVSLDTLRLGIYDAVIQFNDGFFGCLQIFKELGFENVGHFTSRCYKSFDSTRIQDSVRHSTQVSKQRRKVLKAMRKKKYLRNDKKEGGSYKKGAY